MNITVEKQPKCLATVRVEVPADTVAAERTRIVSGYSSQAKIPGYRPGKAPRSVVEKRFAREIHEELESRLVNQALEEAIKKEELSLLNVKAASGTFQPDGAFALDSTIILAPEFTLPEYKGITVKVPAAKVDDELVEKNLTALRERFADFSTIEGRAAAKGDLAVIDFTSSLDGKTLEEAIGKPAGYLSGREGFWVRLDEQSFLPGFAVQLEGLSAGDTKDVPVTIPAEFPVADLREKNVVFHVTVKELKQQVLPEADDEFANKVAPGKTLEEVRGLIGEQLQQQAEREIADSKVNQIVEHFNSLVELDLPEDVLAAETQGQANNLVNQGVRSGMTQEEIETQKEEILNAAGEQAKINLKTNFILQEIARTEKLAVSDQELIQRIAQIAHQQGQQLKPFIKQLQRRGQIPGLRNSMLVGKAIDFVVEHATVEEAAETTAEADK